MITFSVILRTLCCFGFGCYYIIIGPIQPLVLRLCKDYCSDFTVQLIE